MNAIHLEKVGKRYIQQVDRSLLIKRLVGMQGRQRQELWALKDISFDVDEGSTVGVIGRNGSGKTTLLRMLSGVSAPTTGKLRIEGRIAPLIGVGVGFNGELSGRENVFVNGQLLGMSEPEVRRKFDDIVEFAEMGAFIDTPVKYYSSGMFLRLGFSVAIHNEPDVLVVDEVLAVGDGAFQLKCFERMRQMQERGTTVVIVTHNLQALHQMAPRAILLSHGQMMFDGKAEEALGEYQRLIQDEDATWAARAAAEAIDPTKSRMVGGATVDVELLDDKGRTSHHFETGGMITARLTVTFSQETKGPGLGVMVALPGQSAVFTSHTPLGGYRGTHGPDKPLVAEIKLSNRLLTRAYTFSSLVVDSTGHGVLGASSPVSFYVTSKTKTEGIVDLDPQFVLGGKQVEVARIKRLTGRSPAKRAVTKRASTR